jgi:hypothetical protein
MTALLLTLSLVNAAPSATTLAAVAIFSANVDRQWPKDDRAPAVTGEVMRLMAVAARGMADDWKVNDGKLRDAIADFDTAREQLFKHPRGDRERPEVTRDALDAGRVMIDRLAEALNCARLTSKERAALKKFVEEFDDDRPVEQQVDDLAKYFQQAAALVRTMLDAGSTPT